MSPRVRERFRKGTVRLTKGPESVKEVFRKDPRRVKIGSRYCLGRDHDRFKMGGYFLHNSSGDGNVHNKQSQVELNSTISAVK